MHAPVDVPPAAPVRNDIKPELIGVPQRIVERGSAGALVEQVEPGEVPVGLQVS